MLLFRCLLCCRVSSWHQLRVWVVWSWSLTVPSLSECHKTASVNGPGFSPGYGLSWQKKKKTQAMNKACCGSEIFGTSVLVLFTPSQRRLFPEVCWFVWGFYILGPEYMRQYLQLFLLQKAVKANLMDLISTDPGLSKVNSACWLHIRFKVVCFRFEGIIPWVPGTRCCICTSGSVAWSFCFLEMAMLVLNRDVKC